MFFFMDNFTNDGTINNQKLSEYLDYLGTQLKKSSDALERNQQRLKNEIFLPYNNKKEVEKRMKDVEEKVNQINKEINKVKYTIPLEKTQKSKILSLSEIRKKNQVSGVKDNSVLHNQYLHNTNIKAGNLVSNLTKKAQEISKIPQKNNYMLTEDQKNNKQPWQQQTPDFGGKTKIKNSNNQEPYTEQQIQEQIEKNKNFKAAGESRNKQTELNNLIQDSKNYIQENQQPKNKDNKDNKKNWKEKIEKIMTQINEDNQKFQKTINESKVKQRQQTPDFKNSQQNSSNKNLNQFSTEQKVNTSILTNNQSNFKNIQSEIKRGNEFEQEALRCKEENNQSLPYYKYHQSDINIIDNLIQQLQKSKNEVIRKNLIQKITELEDKIARNTSQRTYFLQSESLLNQNQLKFKNSLNQNSQIKPQINNFFNSKETEQKTNTKNYLPPKNLTQSQFGIIKENNLNQNEIDQLWGRPATGKQKKTPNVNPTKSNIYQKEINQNPQQKYLTKSQINRMSYIAAQQNLTQSGKPLIPNQDEFNKFKVKFTKQFKENKLKQKQFK